MRDPQRSSGWWSRRGPGEDRPADDRDGDLFADSDGAPAEAEPPGEEAPADDAPRVAELRTRLAAAERDRDAAEDALAEAHRRADALSAALEDARARPPETFGMRADKVLRMAEHDAAQRRRAAEAEAAELVEQARADAERITAEARSTAEGATAGAQAEVDRLRAAGAAARRDGELVADTAASMHAHVSELRGSVRDELARLHALLGSEIGRLDGPARAPAHALHDRPAEPLPDPDGGRAPAIVLPEQRGTADPAAGHDPDSGAGDGTGDDTTPDGARDPAADVRGGAGGESDTVRG